MSFQLSVSNFTVLDGQECIQVRVWIFTDKCNLCHEKYTWKLKSQICKNWRKQKSGLYTSKELYQWRIWFRGWALATQKDLPSLTGWCRQRDCDRASVFSLVHLNCFFPRSAGSQPSKWPGQECIILMFMQSKNPQAETLQPFYPALSTRLKSCKDRVIWNTFHLQ